MRKAEDVEQLQAQLAELSGQHLGIVLKIETRRAFDELPRLLLACMRTRSIRRDDRARRPRDRVRLRADGRSPGGDPLDLPKPPTCRSSGRTQVLESLAKTGVPSRAEVTDAAMAERAECVMLNKGPFIRQAVRTLDDILRRMQAHQTKKRAMLRPLNVAESVLAEVLAPCQQIETTSG